MARAGELVEHDTGLQRIDREQSRKCQRTADQATDLGQFELADFGPAVGNQADITGSCGAEFADDEGITFKLAQGIVANRDGRIGDDAGQNARNGCRN